MVACDVGPPGVVTGVEEGVVDCVVVAFSEERETHAPYVHAGYQHVRIVYNLGCLLFLFFIVIFLLNLDNKQKLEINIKFSKANLTDKIVTPYLCLHRNFACFFAVCNFFSTSTFFYIFF